MTANTILEDILAMSAIEAAPRLIGARLRTTDGHRVTEVELTEVEAYGGGDDPASHAYRGPTERNRSMFEGPGRLYVYRSYGVHWCANVSTGQSGLGQAVLLRAGIPTRGRPQMVVRRGSENHLSDGPGKLAQALAITGADDGAYVLAGGRIRLLPGTERPFESTPRVGISKAQDRKWRFVAVRD